LFSSFISANNDTILSGSFRPTHHSIEVVMFYLIVSIWFNNMRLRQSTLLWYIKEWNRSIDFRWKTKQVDWYNNVRFRIEDEYFNLRKNLVLRALRSYLKLINFSENFSAESETVHN
jgi:hypothetical protein